MHQRANDIIRRLTRNPLLVELARRLHVAGLLKSWEYRLRGPRDAVVRHAIAGVDVLFAAPDATEFRTLECCYSGELDFVEALAKNLGQGGVFYDIGSNAGQFVVLVGKLVGQRGEVMGFEPQANNYGRLAKNIALNQLRNVRVFPIALGDWDGEIDVFGARGIATVVPSAATRHGYKPSSKAKVARGDDLRAAQGLPLPKAAKIDVEGAEFGVLSGFKDTLSSPICELLCLEVHPDLLPPEVTSEMVFSLVRSLGFNHAETRPRAGVIHLIAEKVPRQS